MKLIIGLGNPGNQYARTRHNFGFIMLDHLAEEFGASWKLAQRFSAKIAEARLGAERIILVKPITFYNLSGEAAQKVSAFYKLAPEDVLVIHDELALPFGTIRTRIGGSDAGNNGIKSLSQHLGPSYARIRLGIGEQGSKPAEAFVLEPFSATEQAKLSEVLTAATRFTEDFIHEDKSFAHTSLRINVE